MRTRGRYPAPPPISKSAELADSWGRNRIDARGKDLVCARHGTTVIGLNRLIANDNFAGEARLAA